MDHETYRTKIIVFQEAFSLLENAKEAASVEWERDKSLALAMKIREMLIHGKTNIPDIAILLPVGKIQSLKDFDMLADSETVARKAEAVKQEIMEVSNRYKLYSSYAYVDSIYEVCRNIDFIRNPSGKIVEPFDYWEDCIEVYLMKYIDGLSNRKIADKFKFKTSATAPGRQREKLVSDLLAETEKLIQAVRDNIFPPMTLSAGKQPTMIN
jgi:hypothetical protein